MPSWTRSIGVPRMIGPSVITCPSPQDRCPVPGACSVPSGRSRLELTASADYLVAEMDYAGVDVAVLQNAGLYGVLNDFFADCAGRYPGRFIPLAQVHESRAHRDEQLAELRRCATALGVRGL